MAAVEAGRAVSQLKLDIQLPELWPRRAVELRRHELEFGSRLSHGASEQEVIRLENLKGRQVSATVAVDHELGADNSAAARRKHVVGVPRSPKTGVRLHLRLPADIFWQIGVEHRAWPIGDGEGTLDDLPPIELETWGEGHPTSPNDDLHLVFPGLWREQSKYPGRAIRYVMRHDVPAVVDELEARSADRLMVLALEENALNGLRAAEDRVS